MWNVIKMFQDVTQTSTHYSTKGTCKTRVLYGQLSFRMTFVVCFFLQHKHMHIHTVHEHVHKIKDFDYHESKIV